MNNNAHLIQEDNIPFITEQIKFVERFIKAIDTAAEKGTANPSKKRKHQTYSAAGSIIRFLEGEEIARPESVHDLRIVVAIARTALVAANWNRTI